MLAMFRATASSGRMRLTRSSAPAAAEIVVSPRTRGSAAATGLRNTIRSTSRSSGAAISSARRSASTDALCTPAATSAYPLTWALTGGRTPRATSRRTMGTTVRLTASKSWSERSISSASPGRGRSCAAAPAPHGSTTARPRRWSRAASAGPSRSSADRGPRSMTTSVALSPK